MLRRKTASAAAAEHKSADLLTKVARSSHGTSPSNLGSNQTDGVSQMSATLAYDEPGFSIPMAYNLLTKDIRDKRLAEANKAWDMFWFVHGLSFNLIHSPLFRAAILATKRCPAYKPCHRVTLATTHLDSANEDANVFKASRLASGKTFGFLVTSDGWRNHNRRQYHNFILVAATGPIFLGLKDVSGESGSAQAIHDEFVDLFETLDNDACDLLSKQCSASSCEFNWSAVSSVERKKRGSMVVATTDKSVNVSAMYKLSVGRQRDCMHLPTLDAIIEELVEEVEDDAPASTVLSMEEAVFENHVMVGIPDEEEEEEEEEDVVVATEEELDQLKRAQTLLLADWSTRDTLLD